jgi:uncharacterized membrane protein
MCTGGLDYRLILTTVCKGLVHTQILVSEGDLETNSPTDKEEQLYVSIIFDGLHF